MLVSPVVLHLASFAMSVSAVFLPYPFGDHLSLPGGHVDLGENVRQAAVRELAEETAVPVDLGDLTLVGVYDAPGRDPRGPYRTTAYLLTLQSAPEPTAADDARTARWVPISELPEVALAFDHRAILDQALTER